jgi:hypothetical protein
MLALLQLLVQLNTLATLKLLHIDIFSATLIGF